MSDSPPNTQAPVQVAPPLFPEYEAAVSDLLWTVLNALMAAMDPVLGQISKQPTAEVPDSGPQLGGGVGDLGNYRPMNVSCEFVQPFDSVLNVDSAQWAEMVAEAAQGALRQLMPQIFAHMADVCDAAGTTVDASGKPFSFDLFLDVLEGMSIDFDEQGEPRMPTVVVPPKVMDQIRKLPPPTPAQLARREEILSRKKQEFYARRRVRKLDQDP